MGNALTSSLETGGDLRHACLMRASTASIFAAFIMFGSCVSTPPPPRSAPPPQPAEISDYPSPLLPEDVRAAAFDNLPGWASGNLVPSLQAFSRSCASWQRRDENTLLSSRAPYAGRVRDWLPACAAMGVVGDEASARTIMEALFVPVEILSPDGKARFTGYFEPEFEARHTAIAPFTEPVPGLPEDLVPDGANPKQRLAGGHTRPYPARADISPNPAKVLGYAHPADVFFLQIQGSGRLQFPDGSVIRAAYAAHNGHRFVSTANWLLNTGRITRGEASMQGIRAWMDRAGPAEARQAMNANPRYVFFSPLPVGDPNLGPKGAQSVPLTRLGSLAVDTDLHPLGVPMFIETEAPGLGGTWSGLLVAQDTGGAIKGAVRGDIYFGTGPAAGRRAGTMNAPGRMWALLPASVAARLSRPDGPGID